MRGLCARPGWEREAVCERHLQQVVVAGWEIVRFGDEWGELICRNGVNQGYRAFLSEEGLVEKRTLLEVRSPHTP